MKRLFALLVVLVAAGAANATETVTVQGLRWSTRTVDVRALLDFDRIRWGIAVSDNGDTVGLQLCADMVDRQKSPIIPYVSMGLGIARATDDSEQADNHTTGNLGVGLRAELTKNIGLLAEYRVLSQVTGPGLGVGFSISF